AGRPSRWRAAVGRRCAVRGRGGLRARLRGDDRRPRRAAGRAARAGMSVKAAALAVLLVALVALPPLAEPYVLHVAIVVLINAVYAEALYVIMRMGYLSFGHAGYIALGAYTSALLATKLGVSPWLGILAGALVAAGFASLLGLVTLKLRRIYFSLSVFPFPQGVSLPRRRGLRRPRRLRELSPPFDLGRSPHRPPGLFLRRARRRGGVAAVPLPPRFDALRLHPLGTPHPRHRGPRRERGHRLRPL